MSLPMTVVGKRSPYPTLVMVWMAHHMDSGMLVYLVSATSFSAK